MNLFGNTMSNQLVLLQTILYFGAPFAALAWMITLGSFRNVKHLDTWARKALLFCFVCGLAWVGLLFYVRGLAQ